MSTRVGDRPAHPLCGGVLRPRPSCAPEIEESAGIDASWQTIHVVRDQLESLADDVQKVRTHPAVPETVTVGGFVYDVDTGMLDQKF